MAGPSKPPPVQTITTAQPPKPDHDKNVVAPEGVRFSASVDKQLPWEAAPLAKSGSHGRRGAGIFQGQFLLSVLLACVALSCVVFGFWKAAFWVGCAFFLVVDFGLDWGSENEEAMELPTPNIERPPSNVESAPAAVVLKDASHPVLARDDRRRDYAAMDYERGTTMRPSPFSEDI